MYEQNLALNNPQGLIYHKTLPTKQPSSSSSSSSSQLLLSLFLLLVYFVRCSILDVVFSLFHLMIVFFLLQQFGSILFNSTKLEIKN